MNESTVKETSPVRRREGMIAEAIKAVCEREVTWYEGKLETEIVPAIRERLQKQGIKVSADCVTNRMKYMNIIETLKKDSRFVVATFSDGSVYAVPLLVIATWVAAELAAQGDTEIQDELRHCLSAEKHSLLGLANVMPWNEVKAYAQLLSNDHPVAYYEKEWPNVAKEVMTAAELDRYKLQQV